MAKAKKGAGAKAKLKEYFVEKVGQVLDSDELRQIANSSEWARRVRELHLGHTIDKSMGGTDEPSNLKAICSVCNEGASNVTLNRPDAMKLLTQLRRAATQDQLEVLQWIVGKFPKQASDFAQKVLEERQEKP